MTMQPRTRRNPHPQPVVPASVATLWEDWGTTADGTQQSLGPVLDGVSTIVNALVRDRVTYRVAITNTATAATAVATRQVIITAAALLDGNLTPEARLAVTTGMALHEAGHVRYGLDHIRAVEKRWPSNPTAQRLANILDDCRLEARLSREYAAYAACFPLTLWWVAGRYPIGRITRLPRHPHEATNLAVAATRYARFTSFVGASVQAEARWWIDWARRYTRTDRPRDLIAGVEAALARIDALPTLPDTPGPDTTVCPPGPQPPRRPEDDDEDGDEGEGEGDGGEDDEGGDEGDPRPGGKGREDEDGDDDVLAPHPFVPAAAFAAPGEPLCAQCGKPASDPVHATPSGGGKPDDDEDDDEDDDPTDGGGSDDDEDDADEDGDEDDGSDEDTTDGGDSPVVHTDDETDGGGDPTNEPDGASWDGMPDEEDAQDRTGLADVPDEEPVDALTEPMPLHAPDATTMNEKFVDRSIGRVLASSITSVTDESVEVNLAGHDYTIRVTPLIHGKSGTVETDQNAEAALRGAFMARRTAHDNRAVARSGRLSGTRAYRMRAGYADVFTRREATSPDRLDVHILLDLSGSMGGGRLRRNRWTGSVYQDTLAHAITMGATLVEALSAIPTVRFHVWGHTDTYDNQTWERRTIVYDALDSRDGDPAGSGRLAGFRAVDHSGNNDGQAIATVSALALRDHDPRERTVILVLSDGQPCDTAEVMQSAIDGARRAGQAVISVALENGLSAIQSSMYGLDNVVEWTGDWDALATGMAEVIAKQ